MKLLVYSFFDSKVKAYLPPFYMRADGEAVRAVREACRTDPNFNRYPADYTLFRLGEFDDETGRIVMLQAHENLGNLVALVNQPDNGVGAGETS